jgi:hypothetical protein
MATISLEQKVKHCRDYKPNDAEELHWRRLAAKYLASESAVAK